MRFRRAPVLAVITVLAAVALLLVGAGPAAADHAYSHRYVIVGRVIDVLGEPAMGWFASATFSGVTPDGACSLSPQSAPTTNAYGDFFLCYHVHAISGGTVTVSGDSFSQSFNLNLNLRKTVVSIQLPGTWATKDANAVSNFPTQYTVRGRVWQPAPGTNLEGVPVNGVALTNEPVSVHMIYNSGSERAPAPAPVTNAYGDFATTISLGDALTGGVVHVTAHGVAVSASGIALDTRFMVSDVDVIVPAPLNPTLQFLVDYWWAILAPIAVIVGVWYLLPRLRPRKVSRDVSRIPGIGSSKAQQLRKAGAGTIDRLAEAEPRELAAATGLSVKETKRLKRKAKEFLEAEAEAEAPTGEDEAA